MTEDTEVTEAVALEDVLKELPPSPQAPGHTGFVHPHKITATMVT